MSIAKPLPPLDFEQAGASHGAKRRFSACAAHFDAHNLGIGRADCCANMLAPGFELVPDRFVMHGHASRAGHMEHMRSHGRSGRYGSITGGQDPWAASD